MRFDAARNRIILVPGFLGFACFGSAGREGAVPPKLAAPSEAKADLIIILPLTMATPAQGTHRCTLRR
jgi:hypothetical protein